MKTSETESDPAKSRFFKLRKTIQRIVILFKVITLAFILCIIGTFTFQNILSPYSYYFLGIEISASLLICFMTFKINLHRPMERPKIPSYFINAEEDAKLLWTNISNDINRYESAASYYFKGVRTYKYSTIFLAGLSTIVLGLDLGKNSSIEYAVLSKNIALVIGAFITISTSLFTYWNIEKYWLINKTISNKLTALKHDLEIAFATNSLDSAALAEKFKNYKDVKETFYKYWEGALSERNSQSNGQK